MRHLRGKRLLPKVFKDQNHIDEIKGIYVPFWLFDTDADADIRYRATKVRSWSDKNYNYTETRFFMVARSGNIGFTRVPVDGSTKMEDDLMESIEPFDLKRQSRSRQHILRVIWQINMMLEQRRVLPVRMSA